MLSSVAGKFAGMRKVRQFTVYPRKPGADVVVQSDGCIGQFNPETGEGVLNLKGEYFIHLSPALGAKPFKFPEDFVKACVANEPKSGDEIGQGVYVA